MKIKKTLFLILFLLFFSNAFSEEKDHSLELYSSSQLESLVASIALYPDPILAQLLPASTYPIEIVEASRIIQNKKDFSKIDQQDWDESVKAIAHYPSILKMMSEELHWTQQLGEAVLSQQEDVMKAIQIKRQQAQKAGNLKSNKQLLVHQSEETIEILSSDPKVIYLPTYNPEIVYAPQPVQVDSPLIRFDVGSPIGSWLNIGFFWPNHSIFYCDSDWWRKGWHDFHDYRIKEVTIVNHEHIYPTRVKYHDIDRYRWTHRERYGRGWGRRDHHPRRPDYRHHPGYPRPSDPGNQNPYGHGGYPGHPHHPHKPGQPNPTDPGNSSHARIFRGNPVKSLPSYGIRKDHRSKFEGKRNRLKNRDQDISRKNYDNHSDQSNSSYGENRVRDVSYHSRSMISRSERGFGDGASGHHWGSSNRGSFRGRNR